jgi:4-hydroxybenzoate polyprenyltransferase
MLNLLGDIRGHKGDMLAGVKTLPVIIGIDKSRLLVYLITGLFTTSAILSNRVLIYPLIPFMFLISFSVSRGDDFLARLGVLSSFFFFPAFLLLLNLLGVI